MRSAFNWSFSTTAVSEDERAEGREGAEAAGKEAILERLELQAIFERQDWGGRRAAWSGR